MRIAQVAPLAGPSAIIGRVISWLTDELVRLGHEVTLFANGDWETVSKRSDEFDMIHAHADYVLYPLMRQKDLKNVHTLYGKLDFPELALIYEEYSEIPLVTNSNYQKLPLKQINWQGAVYPGLPKDLYSFKEKSSKYLVFLGKISADKRLDLSIKIAQEAGIPLMLAGEVEPQYYESVIKPLLTKSGIEYLGEIDQQAKNELLGNAAGLILSADYPEPFELVMIESLACGTPIISFNRGAACEVIKNGRTGFICGDLSQAIQAVDKLSDLNRQNCREDFEERFTAKQMANAYLQVYRKLLFQKSHQFGGVTPLHTAMPIEWPLLSSAA